MSSQPAWQLDSGRVTGKPEGAAQATMGKGNYTGAELKNRVGRGMS
jgi:hypothetical protein